MPYSRTLRRRTRSPYLDIIRAQAPYARQAAYDEENRALTEQGLDIQRSGVDLERERLVQQGVEARDRAALAEEEMALQAKHAKTSQIIQGVGTGAGLAYVGRNIYKDLKEPTTTPSVPVDAGIGGGVGAPVYAPPPTGATGPTGVPLTGSEIASSTGGAETIPGTQVVTVQPGGAPAFGDVPGTRAYDIPDGSAELADAGPAAPGSGAEASPGGAPTTYSTPYGAYKGGGEMGAGAKVGTALAVAQQGYTLVDKDFGRSSESYEEGSKGKYGRGLGRTVGTGLGAWFGGGPGATVGGEAGAIFGEKTWPGVVRTVESIDDVGESLAKGEFHKAGETFGESVRGLHAGDPITKAGAGAVGDILEEGMRLVQQAKDILGDICIIITACTNPQSYEVNVCRRYRDTIMLPDTLRGYYMLAEVVVPQIHKSEKLKGFLKKHLVDSLVDALEYRLGEKPVRPKLKSWLITKAFLGFCNVLGNTRPCFARSNGEVF